MFEYIKFEINYFLKNAFSKSKSGELSFEGNDNISLLDLGLKEKEDLLELTLFIEDRFNINLSDNEIEKLCSKNLREVFDIILSKIKK